VLLVRAAVIPDRVTVVSLQGRLLHPRIRITIDIDIAKKKHPHLLPPSPPILLPWWRSLLLLFLLFDTRWWWLVAGSDERGAATMHHSAYHVHVVNAAKLEL
jgi:hypothetical protein